MAVHRRAQRVHRGELVGGTAESAWVVALARLLQGVDAGGFLQVSQRISATIATAEVAHWLLICVCMLALGTDCAALDVRQPRIAAEAGCGGREAPHTPPIASGAGPAG
jgi:hypothetical protein